MDGKLALYSGAVFAGVALAGAVIAFRPGFGGGNDSADGAFSTSAQMSDPGSTPGAAEVPLLNDTVMGQDGGSAQDGSGGEVSYVDGSGSQDSGAYYADEHDDEHDSHDSHDKHDDDKHHDDHEDDD